MTIIELQSFFTFSEEGFHSRVSSLKYKIIKTRTVWIFCFCFRLFCWSILAGSCQNAEEMKFCEANVPLIGPRWFTREAHLPWARLVCSGLYSELMAHLYAEQISWWNINKHFFNINTTQTIANQTRWNKETNFTLLLDHCE